MLIELLFLIAGANADSAQNEVLLPTVVISSEERESKIIPPTSKVAEFVAKDWNVIEEIRPNDPPMECCYEYTEHQ